MPNGAWWADGWRRWARRRRRNCCTRARIAWRAKRRSRHISKKKRRRGAEVFTMACGGAELRWSRCRLAPQKAISQQQPGGDKGQSAEGSDRAQRALTGDGEQIKAPREQHDSRQQQRADNGRGRLRKGAGALQCRDDQNS